MFDIEKLSFPSIDPQTNEVNYLRDRFYESLSIRGYKAKIYLVTSETDDYNMDANNISYKEPISSFLHLEEYPKRTILSAFGWMSETDQQQPIAYLPTYYYDPITKEQFNFYPKRNTKIELEYDSLFSEHSSRLFLVSDIQADSPHVINWICLLVPHREKLVLPISTIPLPDDDLVSQTSFDATSTGPIGDSDFRYLNPNSPNRRS